MPDTNNTLDPHVDNKDRRTDLDRSTIVSEDTQRNTREGTGTPYVDIQGVNGEIFQDPVSGLALAECISDFRFVSEEGEPEECTITIRGFNTNLIDLDIFKYRAKFKILWGWMYKYSKTISTRIMAIIKTKVTYDPQGMTLVLTLKDPTYFLKLTPPAVPGANISSPYLAEAILDMYQGYGPNSIYLVTYKEGEYNYDGSYLAEATMLSPEDLPQSDNYDETTVVSGSPDVVGENWAYPTQTENSPYIWGKNDWVTPNNRSYYSNVTGVKNVPVRQYGGALHEYSGLDNAFIGKEYKRIITQEDWEKAQKLIKEHPERYSWENPKYIGGTGTAAISLTYFLDHLDEFKMDNLGGIKNSFQQLKRAFNKIDEPMYLTGTNGTLVIHNAKDSVQPQRVYTYYGGFGELLEFTVSSEFSEKTINLNKTTDITDNKEIKNEVVALTPEVMEDGTWYTSIMNLPAIDANGDGEATWAENPLAQEAMIEYYKYYNNGEAPKRSDLNWAVRNNIGPAELARMSKASAASKAIRGFLGLWALNDNTDKDNIVVGKSYNKQFGAWNLGTMFGANSSNESLMEGGVDPSIIKKYYGDVTQEEVIRSRNTKVNEEADMIPEDADYNGVKAQSDRGGSYSNLSEGMAAAATNLKRWANSEQLLFGDVLTKLKIDSLAQSEIQEQVHKKLLEYENLAKNGPKNQAEVQTKIQEIMMSNFKYTRTQRITSTHISTSDDKKGYYVGNFQIPSVGSILNYDGKLYELDGMTGEVTGVNNIRSTTHKEGGITKTVTEATVTVEVNVPFYKLFNEYDPNSIDSASEIYNDMQHITMNRLKASAKIVGDPFMFCSTSVTVQNVSHKYSKDWYAKKVTHTINASVGYTCDIEFRERNVQVNCITISAQAQMKGVNNAIRKVQNFIKENNIQGQSSWDLQYQVQAKAKAVEANKTEPSMDILLPETFLSPSDNNVYTIPGAVNSLGYGNVLD